MLTATKIRLYPTADQEQLLAAQFGCARFVWNRALAMKRAAWQERKESLSCYTIKGMLPVWKDGEFPWLKDADSQVMQEVIRHLDRAYRNFFEKRARLPRFKKKHAARQSIAYPQRVKLDGNLAYLPKVGWVKGVVHREIVGKIKTVTVSRESTGKYYASVLADDGLPEIEQLPHIEQITGIDLGLKDALVSSVGRKSGNPKPLRRALSNLKRKQQAMSRKIEAAKARFEAAKAADDGKAYRLRDFFGANIAKDRKRVAVAHERVRNARDDWQHKASRQLADENQAVAAETLNVKGMMKNRRLSRSIADVGWGGLLLKIDYKLKRRGGRLVKIDRWFPSTKTCSNCGSIHEGLTLSDRTWLCTACGTLHDRDENAAENIRRQGILKLKAEGLSVSAHGGGVSRVPSAPATADEVGSLRLQA
ncbi:MAG: transposase [Burkholderiales bacterium]|jgi:putative transposase|nr:transposase [Burkholderiales bacterium]